MVDVVEILKVIDAWLAKTGETDASLSRKATGSPDTIRNWRRSLKSGKSFGVSTKSLEAVSRIVGFDLSLHDAPQKSGAVTSQEEIVAFLRRIEGLPESAIETILGVIEIAKKNQDGSKPSVDRDEHQPEKAPHAVPPSRQR